MPVDASTSINQMLDRVENILDDNLETYCDNRESTDYPLPAPTNQYYVIGEEDFDVTYQTLGGPSEWVSITYGPSRLVNKGSGDTNNESYIQITPIAVAIVMKREAGVDLPDRNGRELLMTEWELRRGESYKGILLDIITEKLYEEGGSNIVHNNVTQTGVTDPIETENGIYREAIIYVDVHQDVNLKRP